jgi:ribonuclease Z
MLNEGKQKMKYILSKVDNNLFKDNMFKDEDTLPIKSLVSILDPEFIKENKIINSSPGFEYILYPQERAKIIKEKIFFDPYIYKNLEFNNFSEEVEKIIKELKEGNNFKWSIVDRKKNKILEKDKYETLYNIQNDPEITFLGTTSMKPGKYRNVSSILLRMSEIYNSYSLLLDCGEGTFQQILDHFGNQKTNEILSKLKVIFITHKHGDHMLGTLKVLSEIDKLKKNSGLNPNEVVSNDRVIYLIAPKTIKKWLQNSINNDLIYKSDIILIDCADINPNMESVYEKYIIKFDPFKYFIDVELINEKSCIINRILNFHNSNKFVNDFVVQDFYEFINKYIGVNIYSIEVFHCDESYGCMIEEVSSKFMIDYTNQKQAWKICYSGDTRPCNNFYNYSYNSTAIIHEATFEDELKQDALEKMHSTFEEAISIGINNQSWKVILTHFSPRYVKYIDWKPLYNKMKILLAHDFLTVKLSNLEWAYYYAKNFSKIMDVLGEKKYEDYF